MSHTGIYAIAYTLSTGRLLYCAADPSAPVYADLSGARIFWSRPQAEAYIAAMPPHCRAYHAAVELAEGELLLYCPGLYAQIHAACLRHA